MNNARLRRKKMGDKDRLSELYRQAEAKRLAIAKILFSPNAWVYQDKHAARLSAAVSEFVGIIGQHEEALKVVAGDIAR